jgi:hypothetical protein
MPGPDPADFSGLIARLAGALDASGIPFMLIGGQAVLVHGEPRLTQDIDITLGVSPDRAAELVSICARTGLDPLPDDVEEFVRQTFVLPAEDARTGIRADFIFSTTNYEAHAIERAIHIDIAGTAVPFAAPEDLILHKLFAGRPRDIEDARGVVRRQGERLDWHYIRQWADEFSAVPGREDLPHSVERLQQESGHR